MVDFAKYAFNKSHAAAYAVIAYQTAYLKCYHKIEFMAALMTSVKELNDKVRHYIESCKKQKICILSPDINIATAEFSVIDNKIMYGLSAIKSVGIQMVKRIINERNLNGPFVSLTDFCERVVDMTRRCLEGLIYAGAFDSLGGNRRQYHKVYGPILNRIHHNNKTNIAGQLSLFGNVAQQDDLPKIDEFIDKELLKYEKEVLGIYLSGHPLDKVAEQMEILTTHRINELHTKESSQYEQIIIAGVIVEKKLQLTKNGAQMAFITVEDLTGVIECLVFPEQYRNFSILPEDEVYAITGRVSMKSEDEAKLIITEIVVLNSLIKDTLILELDHNLRTPKIRQNLLDIFSSHKGSTRVVVRNKEDKSTKAFPAKYNIEISENIINSLGEIIPKECIILQKYDLSQ